MEALTTSKRNYRKHVNLLSVHPELVQNIGMGRFEFLTSIFSNYPGVENAHSANHIGSEIAELKNKLCEYFHKKETVILDINVPSLNLLVSKTSVVTQQVLVPYTYWVGPIYVSMYTCQPTLLSHLNIPFKYVVIL